MTDSEQDNSKTPLHLAFTIKNEGRKPPYLRRWLELGRGRVEAGDDSRVHVYLDRLPVGGFNGYIYLAPVGAELPELNAKPKRPGLSDASEDEEA